MIEQPELLQKMLGYIKIHYEAEFIGYSRITKSNNIYTVELGFPNPMNPTFINIEADSDEDFLISIEKDLLKRNYIRIDSYKVIRIDETN